MAKDHVVSVIDVGSSKIVCLIAEVDAEHIQIIGVSTIPSKGIKKGVVVDIDESVEAVYQAVKAAERMAGVNISRVWVTVNGNHISSVNSQGVVAVSSNDGEIQPADVERVTEAARAISMPNSREIIHVIPRTFIVDSQEGIDAPVGMTGVRLQVETNIITGAATSMHNLVKCVQQVGLDVENLVFTGLASTESVINNTEKELGVVLVDIGGGTTDVVVMVEGSPVYSSVLKIGGKNLTADIAIGLRVSMEEAEEIKKFVSLKRKEPVSPRSDTSDKSDQTDEIDLSSLGFESIQKVERKFLIEGIINPRLEEIADEVLAEVKKSGNEDSIPAGIVLCGGASQTLGIKDLMADVLDLPVRVGKPSGVSGLIDEVSNSAYSASIGAVIYAVSAGGTARGMRGMSFPSLGVGGLVGKFKSMLKGFMP